MPFDLERLEDRLAPTTIPAAPPDAPRALAVVSPAESEAALDPLRTRLGPRQEAPLLFPASANFARPQAVAVARLDPADELDEEPADDVPQERPAAAVSDAVMSDPGDWRDGATSLGGEA